MSTNKKERITFIGGGNMAEALVRGLVASGREAGSITVTDPLPLRRRTMSRRYRVATTADNVKAAASASVVVLAIKPQTMDAVLAELGPALDRPALVVSIAAGVKIARLERAFSDRVRVVRVMPNTPCLVGRGASVLCPGSRARPADVRRVKALLATVGKAFVVDDEKKMDAVTGLSGSGPAYVYLFAEALIGAGVRAGLPEDLARDLTYETIAGAAAMMIETGREPADLRKAVSSPGGTTLAGLARLDEGGFVRAVADAVAAATRRSRELGRGR